TGSLRFFCPQFFCLHRLAGPIGWQNEILRYGRLKTCATFRFGPQKEHRRNPGYPRSSSAFGSGCARFGFRLSFEFRISVFGFSWCLELFWLWTLGFRHKILCVRPMVGYPSGQRGQTVNLLAYAFDGSNPSPTTTFKTGGKEAFSSNAFNGIGYGNEFHHLTSTKRFRCLVRDHALVGGAVGGPQRYSLGG